MMKKIFAFLLALALIASLAACKSLSGSGSGSSDGSSSGESVISTDKFEITLPDGYHLANEYIPDGSEINYMITDKNDNIGISFIEESISDFDGTEVSSLDDYLQIQHDGSSGLSVSEIQEEDGLKYFEYTYSDSDGGSTFEYFTTALSTETSYWTVQGFCLQSEYESLKPDFARWILSINFK